MGILKAKKVSVRMCVYVSVLAERACVCVCVSVSVTAKATDLAARAAGLPEAFA